MLSEGNADGKWSEKKMEEDSLKKVECLRGRLFAERAASRNAKEESEIMGIKMIELESKLKEETKSMKKAVKKLKYLMKKLESMNISYELSEHSSLLNTDISSTASQSEDKESVGSSNEKTKSEGNSQMTTSSEFEFSKSDADCLNSSTEENGGNEVDFQEDKSLALVPIDQAKTKQAIDPVVLDATVREVLDSLRHAKEKLGTQMETRQMIKAI